MSPVLSKYLTKEEVRARLRIGKATLDRWIQEGHFPRPVMLAPTSPRFLLSDLEAWEAGRGAAPTIRAKRPAIKAQRPVMISIPPVLSLIGAEVLEEFARDDHRFPSLRRPRP